MWKPNQLLDPVVAQILSAYFKPEYVEFLGWMNGRAQALNKNWVKHKSYQSLVKAANTMLAAECVPEQFKALLAKKLRSIQPVEDEGDHGAIDTMLAEFRKSVPNDGFWRDEDGNTSDGEDFPEDDPAWERAQAELDNE